MEHYQVKKPCGICKREIIADIFSIGSGHQSIEALTHGECAVYEFEGTKDLSPFKKLNHEDTSPLT